MKVEHEDMNSNPKLGTKTKKKYQVTKTKAKNAPIYRDKKNI